VECYLHVCIFKSVSFINIFPFLVRLWARSELIPTGNTTKKRQNNATFVSYDTAKARNGFGRSNCTYTREFDVIPATGASYYCAIIAQCQLLRNVRGASKTRHFEKFKINISTRSPYSNEILYTKALEYKEYFAHIAVRKLRKLQERFKILWIWNLES
jgi:hypothetical protein